MFSNKAWNIFFSHIYWKHTCTLREQWSNLRNFAELAEAVQIALKRLFVSWGETKCRPMPFRWRADNVPSLNAGLVALWFSRGSGPVLLRYPFALWFFRERKGSGPPVSPSGSAMVSCESLEYGVRPSLDSLDGRNMVLRDDIARPHCTRIIEEYKNKQNIAIPPWPSLLPDLKPYRTREWQADLTCLKPGTSRIKAIVAGVGQDFMYWTHVPSQFIKCAKLFFDCVKAIHNITRK